MDFIRPYIETHKDRFRAELFDLLRIPSVSADSVYQADVGHAAEWVAGQLETIGVQAVEICKTEGHPIVLGHHKVDDQAPTILVYGHYDVQPPDPVELWDSPPFEPTVKDGAVYARGASDDKGQMFAHLKAFELLQATRGAPCNVTFLIEGEEEVGSQSLPAFVAQRQGDLAADVVLISDTDMGSLEHPCITTGLRGLSYVEVEVTGPNRDLHSGMYGGAVQNPINALCQMIACLHDGDGRVTVPGFYDDVALPTEAEGQAMAAIPFDVAAYQKSLDLGAVYGEAGFTTRERTSIRPTLDVNGIWGGYTGEGAKTVIASKACAKISMRLVPRQNSAKITQLFAEFFPTLAPPGVRVAVKNLHGGEAAVTATDSKAYRAASRAFEVAFGKTPHPLRSGGSNPIVALFKQALGVDTVLLGLGLPEDALHSPNEHFGLENFYRGIEAIAHFHHNFKAP
ncbi:MAG: dipeptidase [Candidatus Competibacterales bacterium]